MNTLHKKRISLDLIALAAFGAVFACVFVSQQLGMGLVDEQFYHTIVKRLLQGDRLFVDEWHLSQLISVLLILPCKLYIALTGGAAGIILAMRRLCFICELLFGGYVYIRLRKFGFPALLFALALCVFFPYYTFTYYTIAIHGLVFILVTLFAAEKKPSGPVLALIGAAAAVTVLAEPILAVGYVLYTAQVFALRFLKKSGRVRESRAAAIPAIRTWAMITAAVFVCFAVFMGWLFFSYGGSFRPLLRELPELFTGSEYSFDSGNPYNNVSRFGLKLIDMLRMFGFVPPVLMGLTAFAAVLVKRLKPHWAASPRCSGVYLLLMLAFLSAAYVCLWRHAVTDRSFSESRVDNIALHGVFLPVLLFACGSFPLMKAPPALHAALLQTGVFASVLVDFSSDFCACFAGGLALLPALCAAGELAERTFGGFCKSEAASSAEAGSRRGRVFSRAAAWGTAAVFATCMLFWPARTFAVCGCIPAVGYISAGRNGALEPIASGPMRGIRVIPAMNRLCEFTERDMAAAARLGTGPLYVDSFCPLPYLYAENPMGSYSSFYVEEDRALRAPRYWELHPEKTPEVIYIPYYAYMTLNYFDRLAAKSPGKNGTAGSGAMSARVFFDKNAQKEKLALLERYFDFELIEGEAGFLVHVTGRARR